MAEIRGRPSWNESEVGTQKSQIKSPILNATELSSQVNAYTISSGPPKRITVPTASKLAQLQEISASGTLLQKQSITIDPNTSRRKTSPDPNGYTINPNDGDLNIDLGPTRLQPHITCELQAATPFLNTITSAIGQQVTIGGFFRCLFEHPGFAAGDDAHIFEIHPVRTATISGRTLNFVVGIPDQQSIHTWTSPHPLNAQDGKIKVQYDSIKDTLTFSGMDGQDENYVRVSGTVSQVQINSAGTSKFVITSPEIGHPISTLCLQGTDASKQLAGLKGSRISMIALRNIDLIEALKNRYLINLLGIDIQPA